MRRFEGKAVLITGAASGIGRATAKRLAAEGGRVHCVDVLKEGLDQTLSEISGEKGSASGELCDVSNVEQVRAAVAGAVERMGGLDVLCNVAGVGGFQHTLEVTPEQWGRTIAINLSGTFFMCQAALPHLLSRKGAIVNFSSTAGLIGQAYSAAYCASKGGVLLLTKALAVEYARKGLRVNCLCPGGVDTPLIAGFKLPEGGDVDLVSRLALIRDKADPGEIAGAVAYLASDEARYVNGSALSIDGGVAAS
jgi:meso-butanediol dehydrogenase/(S,S)-butanediol dehydrogenase/diacetyl reductase